MSGAFRAATARVHLAAMKRNGVCANLCDVTDDAAESRRAEFRTLIAAKRKEKSDRARKRKYQSVRLQQQEDAEVQILQPGASDHQREGRFARRTILVVDSAYL